MIVISLLRARPALSVFAGLVAGIEMLLMYLFAMVPRLPADTPPPLLFPTVIFWPLQFIIIGAGTAVLARYMITAAERALHAVREQDLLAKYLLHERIGEGGMAEVFRATYTPEGGFERRVAVKRVRAGVSNREHFTKFFQEEARLGALMHHQNIVQVLDVGKFNGVYILAMEYVDGAALNRLLRTRPLSVRATVYLASEIASALEYVHSLRGSDGAALKIVHRDVNPPNVLVSRSGEVKLADFGVAQAATRASMTDKGTLYGKIRYMAPEQLLGHSITDAVDLYGLGLVMHECLCGMNSEPVEKSVDSQIAQTLDRKLPSVSALRQDVPIELDQLVSLLLDRDPRQRPSAKETRDRLLALGSDLDAYPGGRDDLAERVKMIMPVVPPPAGRAVSDGDLSVLPPTARIAK
jgi:serine/threonine-protein kinase